jgi:hypothetical protein
MKKKTSKASRVIRAYAENLPGDALEVFRREFKDLLGKNKAGIYVLYKGCVPYYVGKAINLPSRINDHTRDRLKNKWDEFSFYVAGRTGYSKHLESLLLRIVLPKGARKGGRLTGAENLRDKFVEDLEVYSTVLEKLKA